MRCKRQTQTQRIVEYLRCHATATYFQLATVCKTNCPWKRIQELEQRGYRFTRRWSEGPNKYRLISLAVSPK